MLDGTVDGKARVLCLLLHGDNIVLRLCAGAEQTAVLSRGVARVVRIALGNDGRAERTEQLESAAPVKALHHQSCRRKVCMGQADEAPHGDDQHAAARRRPREPAVQRAFPQVQHAPLLGHAALPQIQALAVGDQDQAFRVHHIADGLVVFGIAVGRFAVDDGLSVKHAVEKAALNGLGACGRLFLEIAPHADKAVAQGKDRFALSQPLRQKDLFADLPGLNRVSGFQTICFVLLHNTPLPSVVI